MDPDFCDPEPSLPDSCDKCKRTTCYVLETYSVSICPYNVCPDCCELEELDAQIMELHKLAVDLSKRRHAIKERINRRHDRFTSHLPVELFSEIFRLVVHTPSDRKLRKKSVDRWNNELNLNLEDNNPPGLRWNPVLTLGAVCRRWREITLGIPILWSRLSIDPLSNPPVPDISAQWLSRSGDLPLFLEFRTATATVNYDKPPEMRDAMQLLTSHGQTKRWKDLTLLGTTAILPVLLTGLTLEDKLFIDSLRIDMDWTSRIGSIEYPFVPTRLHIRTIPVSHLPVQWDRLTYLKAKYIALDGLLHIIQNARNLRQCFLHYVEDAENRYPISTSPVINDSVKELDIKFKRSDPTLKLLLDNLTFPALETLRFGRSVGRNTEDMNALREFVDRSQPALPDFVFRYISRRKTHTLDWYGILPSITSLELDIHEANKEISQNHIDSLGAHVEPIAFPLLQNLTLKINPRNTYDQWWKGFVAVFYGKEKNTDTTPIITTRRLLKTVTVMIHPLVDLEYKIMDRETYCRLRDIQTSGVELKILNMDGTDILGPHVELNFAEHDDDLDDECRADEMGKDIEDLY